MRASKTEIANTISSKPVMRPWNKSTPGLILLDASLNPVAFNLEAAFILAYPERPNLDGPVKFRIPEQILNRLCAGRN